MKKAILKKVILKKMISVSLAIGFMFGMTACGNSGYYSSENQEIPSVNVMSEQAGIDSNYIEADSAVSSVMDAEIQKEALNRAYDGPVADRFPDADSIEQIGEGRFIILYRDRTAGMTEVDVYDINSDTVINTFKVNNMGTHVLEPIIYPDMGFGFITKAKGKEPAIYGYYYDTDGNLVSKFTKEYTDKTYVYYTLSADGKAMYVTLNDRIQCACGFDFKADYTTEIYAVYADESEKLLKEFDSHTDIYLIGATADGRLVFKYFYNPADKVILTHEEYEKQYSVTFDINDLDTSDSEEKTDESERGYAVLRTDVDDPGLEKIYMTDTYYDHMIFKGDKLILSDNDEIVCLFPDENGSYKDAHYEGQIGLKGYYTDIYVSSSGDYIIYPTYTDEFEDTTITAVKNDNGKLSKIYEKEHEGWKIDFAENYNITMLDEETGDFFALYSETKRDGVNNKKYNENIFEH